MLTRVPDPNLQLPREYSASQVEQFFKSRPLEVAARTWEILAAVVPYLARFLVWEHLIRRKIKHHEGLQKKYAVELREVLTSLGPCFIKLGQAVSIRPDLLPSSFLFELQKLCDAVLTELPRLLDTDAGLILRSTHQHTVLTTSADVIHACTLPRLGVKVDAVPGRLNSISLHADKSGVSYGQCSEICGANHSFIPIKAEFI